MAMTRTIIKIQGSMRTILIMMKTTIVTPEMVTITTAIELTVFI